MTPLLATRDLCKVYERSTGPISVLKGCGFELAEGEVVAIVGASGSGKSTFLNILGGLDWPTSGEVLHRDEALRFGDHDAMTRWRRSGVGFVFQFHFLLPDFNARENLLIPLRAASVLDADGERRADHLLEVMGLADRADHLPGELSGGQQQRVALARAFMNRPPIVLADEPFGNLDGEISAHLGDLLFRISRDEGTSMVIVTHDPELARRADRILHLQEGGLTPLDGTAADRTLAALRATAPEGGDAT